MGWLFPLVIVVNFSFFFFEILFCIWFIHEKWANGEQSKRDREKKKEYIKMHIILYAIYELYVYTLVYGVRVLGKRR